MSTRNPYSVSRPGNLFTGYERLRQRIIDGLGNGHSYAITGGRRCEKPPFSYKLPRTWKLKPGARCSFCPDFLICRARFPTQVQNFSCP